MLALCVQGTLYRAGGHAMRDFDARNYGSSGGFVKRRICARTDPGDSSWRMSRKPTAFPTRPGSRRRNWC